MHWDYLIVKASNEQQAASHQAQLDIRKELGFIPQAETILVAPDPGGKRVGSGGSTVSCLLKILSLELKGSPSSLSDVKAWLETPKRLRILIIHAGGDSRRLLAYRP